MRPPETCQSCRFRIGFCGGGGGRCGGGGSIYRLGNDAYDDDGKCPSTFLELEEYESRVSGRGRDL